MAYKKYITKNGKVYGPYIYHSRRVNGKVVSEYRGPKAQTSSRKIFIPIIASVFLIGIFIAIFSINGNITGQATLDLTGTYQQGEPLLGNLNLNLKQGELIPANSQVIFAQENITYEYLLSDLVTQEQTQGDFYIENSNIMGQGEGYGLIGSTKDYQTVYFKLKLITEEETSGGSTEIPTETEEPETPIEPTPVEEPNETTTAPTEQNETEIAPEKPTKIPQEEVVEPETPTESIEEDPETITEEIVEETPTEEPTQEAPVEETPESEPKPEEPTPEPETTITGNIIRGIAGGISNFFLGLTPTGQVSLELEEEIQRDVSEGNPFEYTLKDKQTAEIVEGSVRTDSKELSTNVLEISQEDRTLTIQTDYSEGEECFGQECLGEEEIILSIDFLKLNLLFGEGDLKISIISQNQEIVSLETTLEENISIETEEEAPEGVPSEEGKEPTIEVNETNQTIELNQTNETTTLPEIQNLTENEMQTLKENLPPMSGVKQTAKEYKEWIIVEFNLGEYNAEFSYDKELPEKILEYLIEKDKTNWLRDLANQFSEEKSKSTPLENLTETYII